MSTPAVLVVDDDNDLCEVFRSVLERHGYPTRATTSGQAAKRLAQAHDVAAVLLDIELGTDSSGLEVCREIVACRPNLPVVIVTGHDDLDNVVRALRAGAFEFIRKPVTADSLVEVVGRAIAAGDRRRPLRINDATEGVRPPGIIGESPAMMRLFADIVRVSRADTTAVVTGETGTGKELVARAIHALSGRREAPFVAINCAAMTSTLLESELFGHAQGAFTDAKSRRDGLFVAADGGTLFLDEIGEMGLDMQSKLLRALQSHRVRAVGATAEVAIDVRLIAATNRALETEVARGAFREDVYYRIHVVNLEVPPLRERGDDVLLIARHLLAQSFAERPLALGEAAEKKLLAYSWPGNVRELENVITRAGAVVTGAIIDVEHLPRQLRDFTPSYDTRDLSSKTLPTLEEVEQSYISHVLEIVDGNKTTASKILGMNRRTLYRKIARFNESSH